MTYMAAGGIDTPRLRSFAFPRVNDFGIVTKELKSPEFVPGPDVMRPFGTSLRHRGVAFRQ